jgi:hypothetical protein
MIDPADRAARLRDALAAAVEALSPEDRAYRGEYQAIIGPVGILAFPRGEGVADYYLGGRPLIRYDYLSGETLPLAAPVMPEAEQ